MNDILSGVFTKLVLLTISNHFVAGEVTSVEERQMTFTSMMEVALDTIATVYK